MPEEKIGPPLSHLPVAFPQQDLGDVYWVRVASIRRLHFVGIAYTLVSSHTHHLGQICSRRHIHNK